MKGMGGGKGLGGRSGSGFGSVRNRGWSGEVGRGNFHWVKLWEVDEDEDEDSGSHFLLGELC